MATVDDKKIIFSMVGVSKIIPQNRKQILKDIYLSFFYGAKIGIIGLNGAGKSTLMKIIAGLEQPTQGEVVWSPGYSVGYLPQDPPLDEAKTVKQNVMEGVKRAYDALAEYEDINRKFGEEEYYSDPDKMDRLMQRQAEVQDIIDATDAWNMDSKLDRAMAALRCPPGDWPVTNLSGGERRRVALCRLLLQKPDVLLLDEPTNHLDAESIDWLEQHLQQYEGTVIAVTHDRYFLDDVSEWILELDRGEGIPWHGNYSSWLDQKTRRMAQEEKQASKRRKALERELEWAHMAPKARQAKGKARLNAYEQMLGQEQKEREEKLEIFIPNGPRLGNKVIEAQHVRKAFGDKVLFSDLNFMLPPNGIVGVIGPNGAGKTLIRASTRLSRRVTRLSAWAGAISTPAPTSRVSISRVLTRTSSVEHSPVASATVCSWPWHSSRRAMCCSSTSPLTILTLTRCARSRKASTALPVVLSSSATTAGSWTASAPTFLPLRATARFTSSREATLTTRLTKPVA